MEEKDLEKGRHTASPKNLAICRLENVIQDAVTYTEQVKWKYVTATDLLLQPSPSTPQSQEKKTQAEIGYDPSLAGG